MTDHRAILEDTELVLFADIVEKAVRHYIRVEPKAKFACKDFLLKRDKLKEARKKRPK